jgi:FkbM family methyltransferase
MLHGVHVLGSRLRHTKALERQRWLWDRVEPTWKWAFGRLSRRDGFLTHLNGDVFRLEYEVGARYERADKHAYETLTYGEWTKAIAPGMTTLDIGAHYGFFSLAAAARVGPQGRVYAFEPAPATLAILRGHVRLNRFTDRLIVVPKVVADTVGVVKFYSEGTSMSASLGKRNLEELCPRHPAPGAIDETMVQSTTIDLFGREQGIRPDVIKVDVEGAELLTLRGGRDTLIAFRPRVLCEIHPLQMAHVGHTVDELRQFVDSVNYTIRPLDEPGANRIFHVWLESRS